MKNKILLLMVLFNSILISQEIDLKLAQSTYLTYQQKNKSTALDPDNLYIKSDNYIFYNFINMTSRASISDLLFNSTFQLDYNELNKTKYDFTFKEAYLSYDLSDNLQLLAGRKFINWGVAYYIRPSAFLDNQKNVSDFNDRGNKFVGNDVVELDYYLGDVLFRGVYKNSFKKFDWQQSSYVGNINFLVDGWSVNLIGGYDNFAKLRTGFNFTKVLTNQLEIHGEYINEKNLNNYGIPDQMQLLNYKDRVNKFTVGFLLSMNISNRDVRLISEYNYDEGGFTENQWNIYKSFVNNSLTGMQNPSSDVRGISSLNYFHATTAYNVQAFSKSSIIFIVDNLPPLLNFINYQPIVLYNPSDQGSIFILNLSVNASNSVNFFFNTNYYSGNKNSIYFNIPHKYQMYFGISTNFDLLN